MTRRAFPYTPFDKTVQTEIAGRPRLPMDCPDLIFRNHYPHGTRTGERNETHGNAALVVPIEPIFTSGPETARGASHLVSGGVVKGYMRDNTIRIKVLVSRNLFSPVNHKTDAGRNSMSAKIPKPAVVPSKDIGMPPKMGKRGTGGNFTIPAPLVTPDWPTSAQWLKSRFG